MSDDILTLLRKYQPYSKLHGQAADEIERLREQNEYLKANVEMLLGKAKAVRLVYQFMNEAGRDEYRRFAEGEL